MNRLDDLLAFVRVAETRSFTTAASRLGVSKSVISRRLSDLEARLGARLLNRTTRRLSLTEAGQAFHDRCVRILGDLEEAERLAGDLHAAPRGLLRIAAPVSFGMLHLAPAVAGFMASHPAIEVDIDLNDRTVDLVEEGYDLAVRIGRLRDSSLIARRLAPSRRVVVGSPAYLNRRGRPQRPEDLADHNCLIYTSATLPDLWLFQDGGTPRTLRVTGSLRSNNGDFLCEATIAGVGLCLLPTFLCGPAVADGRLEAVLLDHELIDSAVHAVYPHSRQLSAKVRAFVDHLAGRFGPAPYWDAPLPGRSD